MTNDRCVFCQVLFARRYVYYLFEIRFLFYLFIIIIIIIFKYLCFPRHSRKRCVYNLPLHCVVTDLTKRDVVDKNETTSCSSTEWEVSSDLEYLRDPTPQ